MKRRMTKDGTVRPAAQTPLTGMDRREFIKASALVAGMGVWVASSDRVRGVEEQSANEKINVASIGIGGKGDSDSEQAAKHANLVAICDIDEKRLESKSMRHPKAKKYTDFRKMFDEMHKEIDAVTISTPDHTHAVATMQAIKLGKHVYTQKPLAHDVYEARQLRLAAKEAKIASQMGNQGTAGHRLREGVEAIRAGAIGAVKEVYIWTNRPIWPQAPKVMEALPEEPIPANVHWDEFIGTAPCAPSTRGISRSIGAGGGTMEPAHWATWAATPPTFPSWPSSSAIPPVMEGEGGDINPETYPSWAQVVFEFPRAKKCRRSRSSGMKAGKTACWFIPRQNLSKRCSRKAAASPTSRAKWNSPAAARSWSAKKEFSIPRTITATPGPLLPKEEFKDFKAPSPTLPRNENGGDEGQKIEWLEAARGGKPALSNFDYAGMLAEFILLGNVAIKNAGKKLEWDGPNMTFTNDKSADKFLKRTYRAPWSL